MLESPKPDANKLRTAHVKPASSQAGASTGAADSGLLNEGSTRSVKLPGGMRNKRGAGSTDNAPAPKSVYGDPVPSSRIGGQTSAGSGKSRVVPIPIKALNGKAFLRVTNSHQLEDIPPATEESSRKAFNMEEGGARHLFDPFDGLTYPAKDISRGVYHVISDEIRRSRAWADRDENPESIRIASAAFPGAMGIIASRQEYRNEGKLPITSRDAVSIPVALLGHMFHGGKQPIVRSRYENPKTGRSVTYALDFSDVFKAIKVAGKSAEMPSATEVKRILADWQSNPVHSEDS